MIFFKDVNYLSISVVIPAVPASLQQGAVAPKCSKVSQLGPVNTYFKSHFLGMRTRKFKTSGVRPRPKTYGYVTVRCTGHGQLCFLRLLSLPGLGQAPAPDPFCRAGPRAEPRCTGACAEQCIGRKAVNTWRQTIPQVEQHLSVNCGSYSGFRWIIIT